MNRLIIQTGQEVLDTDLLNVQRWTMMALGYLAEGLVGGGGSLTWASQFDIAPTSPASLSFTLSRGALFTINGTVVDANNFGILSADTNPLMKFAINEAPTTFTLTPPSTSGYSINYLIEAQFAETDAVPVVLPFYNASNPSIVLWGPGGQGAQNNTQRLQTVTLALKAGTAATTGTQTTPATDAGFVPLYVVPVAYGQTSLTTANLTGCRVGQWLGFKLRNANARAMFMGLN